MINILTRGKNIFGIKNSSLKIGVQADISLFNPISNYTFSEDKILSFSKNSIFKDSKLKGIVYGSISNGKIILND
ncbi:MAG: hypothetical protein ACJ0O0_04975 [Flavobacteriaceae bacterium]